MSGWVLDTLTTRQPEDGIDVQSLISDDTRSSLYLARLQLATQHHEDLAVLTLMTYPVLVLIVADG